MRSAGVVVAAGSMVILMTMAFEARGQTKVPEDEQLRARHDEASRQMREGKPLTACPILEDIVRTAPSYWAAKQSLAECYVLSGKLLSASRQYEAIEKDAAEAQQEDVRKAALDKRHALATRLSHLRIALPDCLQRANDLEVHLDGESTPRNQWGEARPADRGPHKVEVRLAGKTVWQTVADVWEEGATLEVFVDVRPPYLGCKSEGEASERTMQQAPMNPMRAVGWTVTTVGAATVGIGAGFGLAAWYKKNESDPMCNVQNQCTQAGLDLRNRSAELGNVSTGVLIGGAMVTLAGVILVWVSPRKGNPSTTVGVGPSGVVAQGRF